MSAELIERRAIDRHTVLVGQLAAGIVLMCSALWSIRQEKTYETQGCKSFSEFLARANISPATGRLCADIGPAMVELQRLGKHELVKHAELLKSIHKMIAKAARMNDAEAAKRIAARQARIVIIAAEEADRGLEPLTAAVIERVASERFHWQSAADRKKLVAAKKAEPPKWEHPMRTNARRAFAGALFLLDEPERMVVAAAVHRLPEFKKLLQWFREAEEAARRYDHNAPGLFDE